MQVNVRLFSSDIREINDNDRLDINSEIMKYSRDRERVSSYYQRDDRARCVVGELLTRHIADDSVRNFLLEDGMRIKPVSPSSLLFNLSHDSDFVVLATSGTHSVGVDIMKVKPSNRNVSVRDMLENLRNIFDTHEWEYIQAGNNDETKLKRFYKLWTAKESYVKCLGTGLYTEPQDISLSGFTNEDSPSNLALDVSQNGCETTSKRFKVNVFDELIDDYILAVCVGPVNACNPSWTKFIENSERFPPVDPCETILESYQQISVSTLVRDLGSHS